MNSADITRRMQLQPDRAWNRGDLRSAQSRRKQKFSGWELISSQAADAPIDAHVDDLIARIDRRATALARLIKEPNALASARFWISHHIENWNPGIELLPSQLSALAQMGVRVAFDVYVYEAGQLGPSRIPRSVKDSPPLGE
jgi:hypothetical protein